MQLTIVVTRRKKDERTKMIAVWNPTAAGKTMVAVNLAALFSETMPTALVDLSSDNAVHTWLNCLGDNSLAELLAGNSAEYNTPLHVPKLRVYTAEPGSKNGYNGEALFLNNITRALDDSCIIVDTPREYLKAANILTVANRRVFVADYNIHGTLLLQKYVDINPDTILVVNRFREEYPPAADPAAVLGVDAPLRFPDRQERVLKSVLVGKPLVKQDEDFRRIFIELQQRLGGGWNEK